MGKHGEPIEILLVEDNPGDVELTQEAFADSKICNHLYVANDGVEALEFLRRVGPHANAVRPDVVLLDLNMPRMDGKELLEVVKNDPDLKSIPIVILTSSEAEKDIVKSYKLHANCYINKPVNLEGFLEVVRSMEDFWLSVVKLPKNHSGEAA
ncbi:MAG: response regulator [Alphaproteobacteria bacterium]|nr:response regulator [Alphaproteobacteria bacterium]